METTVRQSVSRLSHPRVGESSLKAFERSLSAALQSAFGRRVGVHASTQAWIRSKLATFKREGDGFLKGFKSILVRNNDKVLRGIYDRRDLGHVLPRWCSDCRNTQKLLQFLKLRRALPKLTYRPYIDKKIDEYVDSVTKEYPSRPVPDELRRVLEKTLSPHKIPKDWDLEPGDFVGAGAALGYPRHEGGRSAFLRTFGADSWSFKARISAPGGVEHSAFRSAATVVRSITADVRKSVRAEKPREVVPLVVREFGSKLRIVTKSDPRLVALGQSVRRRLFPVLKSLENVTTSDALLDPELSVIRFRSPKAGSVVVSADLTAATDLLSHEVLRLVGGILGIPLSLLGVGATVRGLPTTSGTFMGMPVSWTVLSMIHYGVCRCVDPGHNFRIKGDDLIALWTESQFRHYTALARSVGLIVNDKTSVSPHWGTFCEGDYLRKGGSSLHRIPTYSIRPFVKDEILSTHQCRQLLDRGVKPRVLNQMQHRFHKKWISYAAEKGIPLRVPQQFGGLGFVPTKPESPCDPLTASIVRELHNGHPLCDVDRLGQRLGPLTQGVASILSRIEYRADVPPENAEHLAQCSAPVFERAAFADAVVGELRVQKEPSPARIVRGLARFRRIAERRCPWGAPPTAWFKAVEILDRLGPVETKPWCFAGAPPLTNWGRAAVRPPALTMGKRVVPWNHKKPSEDSSGSRK